MRRIFRFRVALQATAIIEKQPLFDGRVPSCTQPRKRDALTPQSVMSAPSKPFARAHNLTPPPPRFLFYTRYKAAVP